MEEDSGKESENEKKRDEANVVETPEKTRPWPLIILLLSMFGSALLLSLILNRVPLTTDKAEYSQSAASCVLPYEITVHVERSPSTKDDELALAQADNPYLDRIAELLAGAQIKIHWDLSKERRLQSASHWSKGQLHEALTIIAPQESAPSCHVNIYALLVTSCDFENAPPEEISMCAKGLYGSMFDYGDEGRGWVREGLAVYVDTIRQDYSGADFPQAFYRILGHEILHALNVHHNDWEALKSLRRGSRADFGHYSTMEGSDWRTDSLEWDLSARTRDHLQKADASFVLPGIGRQPFNCVTSAHRKKHQDSPEGDRAEVASFGSPSCRGGGGGTAATSLEGQRLRTPSEEDVDLHISASPGVASPLAYVLLGVDVTNRSQYNVSVPANISPEGNTLDVFIEGPRATVAHRYLPPVDDEIIYQDITLGPGETIHRDAKLFFGSTGWTMRGEGKFLVQAALRVKIHGEIREVLSNISSLNSESGPKKAECAKAYAEFLQSGAAGLIHDSGIIMYLGGEPKLTSATQGITKIVRKYPHCEVFDGLRTALAQSVIVGSPTLEDLDMTASMIGDIQLNSVDIPTQNDVRRRTCDKAVTLNHGETADQICKRLQIIPERRQAPAGLQGRFLFSVGSSVVDDDSLKLVESLADNIKGWPALRISIAGFADSTGINNCWRSNERSLSTRSLLLTMGIEPSRIVTVANGSAGASTVKGKDVPFDRRVELRVENASNPQPAPYPCCKDSKAPQDRLCAAVPKS